jgi:plasmid stabilization system protein ParE
MSSYKLHPEAYDDLAEIASYIAEDSLDAALRVIDKIFDVFDDLVRVPGQGHRRPDLTSKPLRFARIYDYLIVYAPDERPLWIVGVIHGRRNPRLIAAILRGRTE